MIVDDKSAVSPTLVKIIIENISKVNLNVIEKDAIAILKSWDGSYQMGEVAPTIYFKFIYLFLKNTFEDEMGEERFKLFLQTHLYKRQIAKQLNVNKSVWWDDIKTKSLPDRFIRR